MKILDEQADKKHQGFFAPYKSKKAVAFQLAEPLVAPLAYGSIACADALYASFYLMKGLCQAVTLQSNNAISSFNNFGNHFGGFALAVIAACITPLIAFAAVFTHALGNCINNVETQQMESQWYSL